MKIFLGFLFLVVPMVAVAQNPPGMSDADMQGMMQRMQEMQSCMQQVDQDRLRALEQRTEELGAEVEALCASGKRDQAQKKVISYGKEIERDPAIQTMRKCFEMMGGQMPAKPFWDDEKFSKNHVCDRDPGD